MKTQTVQTANKETTGFDICARHYQFEIFVRQNLLTPANFDLLLKKKNSAAGNNDSVEAFQEPHFKLKSRFSTNVFYADARHVRRISRPSIEWCEPFKFKRYQELDEIAPVYILVGEGPHPASPERLFFFPVRNLRNNRMLCSHLERYSISPLAELSEASLLLSRLPY